MYPQKQNARSFYAKRQREREKSRRLAESQWQKKVVFTPKEGKKMNPNRKTPLWQWIIIIVVFMIIGCVVLAGLAIWNPLGIPFSPKTTEAPTNTPLPTEKPTKEVVAPTEKVSVVVEPTLTPEPITIACNTIQSSTDNGQNWSDSGENLKTESVYDIGDRVTWTNRKVVVSEKAWNEKLSNEELAKVEKTWVLVRYNACDTTPVVFAGGVRINNLEFNDGALFQLKPGYHEIEIRNGELILWYDHLYLVKDIQGTDGLSENEEGRLIHEIRNGNFDIKSKLGLAVTDSLKSLLPDDIVTGIQIVLMP